MCTNHVHSYEHKSIQILCFKILSTVIVRNICSWNCHNNNIIKIKSFCWFSNLITALILWLIQKRLAVYSKHVKIMNNYLWCLWYFGEITVSRTKTEFPFFSNILPCMYSCCAEICIYQPKNYSRISSLQSTNMYR